MTYASASTAAMVTSARKTCLQVARKTLTNLAGDKPSKAAESSAERTPAVPAALSQSKR